MEGDCDDSQASAYPGAESVCGDGVDNDCDGKVDRLCLQKCEGAWPYVPPNAIGFGRVMSADMNGDGRHEIVYRNSLGVAILTPTGEVLYEYSDVVPNYARGRAVFADVDDYDVHGPNIQTLGLLTADDSRPTFYALDAAGQIQVLASDTTWAYDASEMLAWDIDYDGVVEVITSTWCEAEAIRIFRYNRDTAEIEMVSEIDDPEGACQHTNWRLLTDLDGDGTSELLFGNGDGEPSDPQSWKGHLFAERFVNPTTLSHVPYCTGCFDTTIPGLYGGAAGILVRAGDEIRIRVSYFEEALAGVNNEYSFRDWAFDLSGDALVGAPYDVGALWGETSDINDDGIVEGYADIFFTGLFDVDGDEYPDRILAKDGVLSLHLWDVPYGGHIQKQGAEIQVSAALRMAVWWDIDDDGRAEILSTDEKGRVHCHTLGDDSWRLERSLPPYLTNANRTGQLDNYEPNEGADTDGDGIPDRLSRIPSAMTAHGHFYGYLSHVDDVDTYLIGTAWGGEVCVTAPKGRAYALRVWSYEDKSPIDGKADGLVWEDASLTQTKCWSATQVSPARTGEYRYVVQIEGIGGDYSAFWPYWISAPK